MTKFRKPRGSGVCLNGERTRLTGFEEQAIIIATEKLGRRQYDWCPNVEYIYKRFYVSQSRSF